MREVEKRGWEGERRARFWKYARGLEERAREGDGIDNEKEQR
jgi:hypothetical protein